MVERVGSSLSLLALGFDCCVVACVVLVRSEFFVNVKVTGVIG